MDTWLRLNAGGAADARQLLERACGSSRWVARMLERRPFANQAALLDAAREVWEQLGEDDWREAFAHHPQIGDRASLEKRFPATHALSAREQAGVDDAPSDVLDRLATANREYKSTFGYIFVVCASGRSAEEMLDLLQRRLRNDPAREIRVAADEQAAITALRLTSASA
jgi:2-oxo-4-hydroxy-4-carboxy-5-ureidoimidazoline decarboxylase